MSLSSKFTAILIYDAFKLFWSSMLLLKLEAFSICCRSTKQLFQGVWANSKASNYSSLFLKNISKPLATLFDSLFMKNELGLNGSLKRLAAFFLSTAVWWILAHIHSTPISRSLWMLLNKHYINMSHGKCSEYLNGSFLSTDILAPSSQELYLTLIAKRVFWILKG